MRAALSESWGRYAAARGRRSAPGRRPGGASRSRWRSWVPLVVVLLTLVGLTGLAGSAQAAGAAAGAVPETGFSLIGDDLAARYDAAYQVNADGSVNVTQTIDWTFPTGGNKHGIVRTVTVRAGYGDNKNQYRYYDLTDVTVTSPTGAPTDVSITDAGAEQRIRVGSPDQAVSGTQTYVVSYRLAHIVNDIGDGTAEFYYNHVTPSGNEFTYRRVTASVTAPVAATKAACYYGATGSTTPCTAQAGTTSTFATPDIAPGQGASIVTSYPRTAFADLTPDIREGSAIGGSSVSPGLARFLAWLSTGLGLLLPVGAAAGMGWLVWTRGRDERYADLTPGLTPGLGQEGTAVVRGGRRGPVAVQFTPPQGVPPGLAGTVLDEAADVVDVTATLIDLAVRGHLTLTQTQDAGLLRKADWALTWTRSTDRAELEPFEQHLLDGVFAQGTPTQLSALKNSFAPTLKRVQQLMYDATVSRGWFRRDPSRQRGGWLAMGIAVGVLGLLGAFFLSAMVSGLSVAGLPVGGPVLLGGGSVIAGVLMAVLGARMPARTATGSAVLAQIEGFRQYLATAEASQIRWEEAQEIFSRFLPYAMVFGLAKRWAAVFEEVAAAATAAGHTVLMPTWYSGYPGMYTFVSLTDGLDSFSTQAASTFVSTPGSSGSSGFGGGGFSGGGGGGSGGGSW